jgi:hypothetical protein
MTDCHGNLAEFVNDIPGSVNPWYRRALMGVHQDASGIGARSAQRKRQLGTHLRSKGGIDDIKSEVILAGEKRAHLAVHEFEVDIREFYDLDTCLLERGPFI